MIISPLDTFFRSWAGELRTISRIIRIAGYIVLMIVLPAAVFVSLPAEVQYEVAERYVFSVNGDTRTNVALAVMLPTDGPYQRVENLAVSWKGSLEKSAIGTLEVLEMEGFLGGSGSAAAIVSYSVFLRQGSVRWTASDEPCYL